MHSGAAEEDYDDDYDVPEGAAPSASATAPRRDAALARDAVHEQTLPEPAPRGAPTAGTVQSAGAVTRPPVVAPSNTVPPPSFPETAPGIFKFSAIFGLPEEPKQIRRKLVRVNAPPPPLEAARSDVERFLKVDATDSDAKPAAPSLDPYQRALEAVLTRCGGGSGMHESGPSGEEATSSAELGVGSRGSNGDEPSIALQVVGMEVDSQPSDDNDDQEEMVLFHESDGEEEEARKRASVPPGCAVAEAWVGAIGSVSSGSGVSSGAGPVSSLRGSCASEATSAGAPVGRAAGEAPVSGAADDLPPQFSRVMQEAWERRIVWGDEPEEEESFVEEFDEASDDASEATEEGALPTGGSDLSASASASASAPAPAPATAPATATAALSLGKEFRNWRLERLEPLLEHVVWDADKPPWGSGRRPFTKLLLDPNDPYILLKSDLGDAHTEADAEEALSSRTSLGERFVDAFNLSRDGAELYRRSMSRRRHKLASPKLTHLRFAYELEVGPALPLMPAQLARLRRPRLQTLLNRYTLSRGPPAPPSKGRSATEQLLQPHHLRLKKGVGVDGILLTEWIEEHPPLLNRPGMATRLVHYRQPVADGGLSAPAPGALVGEERVVSPAEGLPFVLGAELPTEGSLRAVQSNLYAAPAFEHAPRHTTFLLVRERRPSSEGRGKQLDDGKLTWREVGHVLLLGQQQFVEQQVLKHVPRPNSREYKELIDRRVQVKVQRALFPRERPKGVPADRVRALPGGSGGFMRTMRVHDAMVEEDGTVWPEWMVPKVRETIQMYASFSKDGELAKSWRPKPERRQVSHKALTQGSHAQVSHKSLTQGSHTSLSHPVCPHAAPPFADT